MGTEPIALVAVGAAGSGAMLPERAPGGPAVTGSADPGPANGVAASEDAFSGVPLDAVCVCVAGIGFADSRTPNAPAGLDAVAALLGMADAFAGGDAKKPIAAMVMRQLSLARRPYGPTGPL